ncbi:MAG: hypothetical protein JO340_10305 [Acidobacteriaceae bacterium]|nr:hypothetical protein [Acidobacteriaceae bacterium]
MSAAQSPPAYQRLDAAATVSPDRLEPMPVSAMADAVFAVPHAFSTRQVPDFVMELLKQRFSVAEEAYWNRGHAGVREQDLVAAFNHLAVRLNLPEYAQTSQDQLHTLRMHMLLRNPRFMGLRLTRQSVNGDPEPVSETMSPLQAYHLALTMIDAKLVAPRYQLSPAEWAVRKPLPSSPSAGTRRRLLCTSNSPRMKEMDDRLYAAFDSLSDIQGLEILTETLNRIGIR